MVMIRPPRGDSRHAFNREDLLAVPLCILWGLGMTVWSLGPMDPWTLSPSSGGSFGMGTLFAFLWGFPIALARYLFGW